MARVGDKPVVAPVAPKVSVEDVKAVVSTVTDKVGETADVIAAKNDQFDLAAGAMKGAAKLAKNTKIANRVRGAGAAVGAMIEGFKTGRATPKLIKAGGKAMKLASEALNSPVGKMARGALKGAGIASAAYGIVTAYRDECFKTTGGKIAGAVGAGAVAASAFIPVAGEVIMAAEVLTGGGVTGGVKGFTSLLESKFTGDNSGVNKWVEDAKSGEHGWLIKAAANNKVVSEAVGAWANHEADKIVAVVHGVQELAKDAKVVASAVSDAAHTVSNKVSNAWGAVKSWAW
jgi:hypothetical protein